MTRAIRALHFGLVALTLVLFGSVAGAEPKQKISVLGLEAVVGANGQIDPADTAFAKELTKEIRSRVNNSKSFVLTKDQRELVDEKLMGNCGAELPQCMAPIGASVSADLLLFGKVANLKGQGYKVSLTLVNVPRRQIVGSDANAVITPAETRNPGLANWVREHYKKLTGESSDGTVIITAAGANGGRVLVNGETKETLKSGTATLSLPEGRYRITVEADGFKLWEQDGVTVSADKATELRPDLAKSGGTEPVDTNPNKIDTTTGTENLMTREGTVSTTKKSKTIFKVAAAVGLGGAAITGAAWIYYWQKTKDFDVPENVSVMKGGTTLGENASVGNGDCGKLTFSDGDNGPTAKSFKSSCSAYDKTKILVPTTIGLGLVGGAALVYILMSKDSTEERPAGVTGHRVKKRRNLIVTPVVTPDGTGATLRFDW